MSLAYGDMITVPSSGLRPKLQWASGLTGTVKNTARKSIRVLLETPDGLKHARLTLAQTGGMTFRPLTGHLSLAGLVPSKRPISVGAGAMTVTGGQPGRA